MLTQIIWWVGAVVLFLLLLRGLQARWVRDYPCFFAYNLFVFIESFLLFGMYGRAPQWYAWTYWHLEFVAVLLGSLVVLELGRLALRPFPGTSRVARNVVLFVFAMAVAKAFVDQSNGAAWWSAATYQDLERNLRVVQAFALSGLIVVIVAYKIPRSRHLKGILTGYGLFVAGSVIQLSLLSYLGSSFHNLLVFVQPLTFDLVLFIWLFALWSPVTVPSHSPSPLEVTAVDHPSLITRARRELREIRLGLPGSARR